MVSKETAEFDRMFTVSILVMVHTYMNNDKTAQSNMFILLFYSATT